MTFCECRESRDSGKLTETLQNLFTYVGTVASHVEAELGSHSQSVMVCCLTCLAGGPVSIPSGANIATYILRKITKNG